MHLYFYCVSFFFLYVIASLPHLTALPPSFPFSHSIRPSFWEYTHLSLASIYLDFIPSFFFFLFSLVFSLSFCHFICSFLMKVLSSIFFTLSNLMTVCVLMTSNIISSAHTWTENLDSRFSNPTSFAISVCLIIFTISTILIYATIMSPLQKYSSLLSGLLFLLFV